MSTSSFLKVILYDNNFYRIAANLIQTYAWANFEDLALFKVIKIDFELWTKENQKTINTVT